MNSWNLHRILRFILGVNHSTIRHNSLQTAVSDSYIASRRMQAWQVHSYNDGLQVGKTRVPIIKHPDEVLIKVEAASINPIDIAMMNGYGSSLIGLVRKTADTIEFPLTLGRDFSGIVLARGYDVTDLIIGQKVWGVVPVHLQGSHAETVVVPQKVVAPQPCEVTAIEAASMLYAAVTAYCALWLYGGICLQPIRDRKVLVLGASGGVGSMAVQLLKANNAYVVGTCSADALPLIRSLGVDLAVDYRSISYTSSIQDNGPYEIILDCAGQGPEAQLRNNWNCKKYVTLTTPLLKNTDQYGLVGGLLTSVAQFIVPNIQALSQGSTVRWAYFSPSTQAIEYIGDLVCRDKMRPVIDHVFNFDQTPQAYERMQAGHLRGKVVLDMTNQQSMPRILEPLL